MSYLEQLFDAINDMANDFDNAPPNSVKAVVALSVLCQIEIDNLTAKKTLGEHKPLMQNPEEMAKASGELLDLHWLTLGDARKLDLPAITRSVIDMVEERMQHDRKEQMKKPAPYVRFINGKPLTTEL